MESGADVTDPLHGFSDVTGIPVQLSTLGRKPAVSVSLDIALGNACRREERDVKCDTKARIHFEPLSE
jgi:hypothetical protein